MMRADVDLRGPMFHTNLHAAVQDLMADMTWTIASKAESEVAMLLDRSIRNPTPYYETQITRERATPDARVHDRGVIYGPWLEGTGSRNQTTRFKGYASFRRACQTVDRQVPTIVRGIVGRWVTRMGG